MKKRGKTGRAAAPRLLASELEILDVLWRSQPLTIVETQRALGGSPGYTTVQTRLNRLVKKGVLERSEERPARYSARIAPEQVASHDLSMLVQRVSRGRIVPLVANLVKQRPLTADEVTELKQMIAEAESEIESTKSRGRDRS